MYPDQIAIIKQFMPKFDCIQNHIILFLREYRIQGVENRKCSSKIHNMRIGEDTYVYDGEQLGLKSVFCSDLECFLDNLHESSITRHRQLTQKKKCKK